MRAGDGSEGKNWGLEQTVKLGIGINNMKRE